MFPTIAEFTAFTGLLRQRMIRHFDAPILLQNNRKIINLFDNQHERVPQNSGDEFTPEQLEQFKSCLSTMFKVYYKDHKYDRNGEAYFDGHSDRWKHIWTGSVGDFRVTTDQQSYSSAALAHKVDPSGEQRSIGN